MNCDVLNTGSKGNCTVLEDRIAVDLGVPYKTLEPHVQSIQMVLLTHVHS